jgi:hypothetical protein
MSTDSFFKGLALDTWYKALIYIGGLTLLLSLFYSVKGITNSQLQLISSGTFLIGVGEWKNHKHAYGIKPANAYTGKPLLITRTYWKPDLIGLVLDVAGIVLVVMGIISIAKGANPPADVVTQRAAVTIIMFQQNTIESFSSSRLSSGSDKC